MLARLVMYGWMLEDIVQDNDKRARWMEQRSRSNERRKRERQREIKGDLKRIKDRLWYSLLCVNSLCLLDINSNDWGQQWGCRVVGEAKCIEKVISSNRLCRNGGHYPFLRTWVYKIRSELGFTLLGDNTNKEWVRIEPDHFKSGKSAAPCA